MTHAEQTDRGLALELGDGDAWPVLRSWSPLVVEPDDEPGDELDAALGHTADRTEPVANPMIMILGCGTAGSATDVFAPPAQLLNLGVPAVVASVSTVLGRDIVPVAFRLLGELRALGRAGGRGRCWVTRCARPGPAACSTGRQRCSPSSPSGVPTGS